MNRFQEQTPADLAGNAARARYLRENHEAPPTQSMCDGCRDFFILTTLHLVHEQGESLPSFLCGDCHRTYLESLAEPECNCAMSGDQADASACELHNPPVRRGPQQGGLFQTVNREVA